MIRGLPMFGYRPLVPVAARDFANGLYARFVRIEILIHMKEAAGREKDREDIRQLRLLLANPDDDK